MLSSEVVQRHVRIAHYSALVEASRTRKERRARARAATQVFSRNGGRVKVHEMAGGVISVKYSGVIGECNFGILRKSVLESTQSAGVLLIDMSCILQTTLVAPPIPVGVYQAAQAPGVVICRDDQLKTWREYAKEAAEFGITRVVFSDHRRAQALRAAQVLHRP